MSLIGDKFRRNVTVKLSVLLTAVFTRTPATAVFRGVYSVKAFSTLHRLSFFWLHLFINWRFGDKVAHTCQNNTGFINLYNEMHVLTVYFSEHLRNEILSTVSTAALHGFRTPVWNYTPQFYCFYTTCYCH